LHKSLQQVAIRRLAPRWGQIRGTLDVKPAVDLARTHTTQVCTPSARQHCRKGMHRQWQSVRRQNALSKPGDATRPAGCGNSPAFHRGVWQFETALLRLYAATTVSQSLARRKTHHTLRFVHQNRRRVHGNSLAHLEIGMGTTAGPVKRFKASVVTSAALARAAALP
jgi:hypothetical protein